MHWKCESAGYMPIIGSSSGSYYGNVSKNELLQILAFIDGATDPLAIAQAAEHWVQDQSSIASLRQNYNEAQNVIDEQFCNCLCSLGCASAC